MHPIFDRFTAPVQPKPVSTHFALMTDLSRFCPVPANHPHARLPGILMSHDHELSRSDMACEQAGMLLGGSTAAPTALFAFSVGHHVFMQLLNPLDPLLRGAMKQHCQSQELPMLVLARGGATLRPKSPPGRYWGMALDDTEGRAEVDSKAWLESAGQVVKALPSAMTSNGYFRSAKRYHAYFVVPDDKNHPLYSLVG